MRVPLKRVPLKRVPLRMGVFEESASKPEGAPFILFVPRVASRMLFW